MSAPSSSGGGCCCGPRCRRWRSARAIERPSSRSSRATRLRGGRRSMNCSARWRPTSVGGPPPAPGDALRPRSRRDISRRCRHARPRARSDARSARHRRRRPRHDGTPDRSAAAPADRASRRRRQRYPDPLAISWRGAIVAILAADPREWQRLQKAIETILGPSTEPWTAIAVRADGVPAIAARLPSCTRGSRSRMTSAVAA